jgi:hypothetical protein
VLGERHLLRLLRQYVRYYNDDRSHMLSNVTLRACDPSSRRNSDALLRCAWAAFTIVTREPHEPTPGFFARTPISHHDTSVHGARVVRGGPSLRRKARENGQRKASRNNRGGKPTAICGTRNRKKPPRAAREDVLHRNELLLLPRGRNEGLAS